MTQDDEQLALEAANRLLNEIGVHHPEQVGIDQFLTDVHRVATVYVQSSKASEGAGDAGRMWSFLRSVLGQGSSIQQDYYAGKYPTYEHYAARLNKAARERADELIAMLAAAPKPPEQKP